MISSSFSAPPTTNPSFSHSTRCSQSHPLFLSTSHIHYFTNFCGQALDFPFVFGVSCLCHSADDGDFLREGSWWLTDVLDGNSHNIGCYWLCSTCAAMVTDCSPAKSQSHCFCYTYTQTPGHKRMHPHKSAFLITTLRLFPLLSFVTEESISGWRSVVGCEGKRKGGGKS